MDHYYLIDKLIITAIAYQAVLFAIILFTYNKKYHRSKWILGFYMVLNAFYYASNYCFYSGHYTIITFLYYFIVPVILLFQPFFYLYIKSLTDPKFRYSLKLFWHFIPALTILFINVFSYSFLTFDEKLTLFNNNLHSYSNRILNFYYFLHQTGYHILLGLQAIIYFLIIVWTIYKFRKKKLKENFANDKEINLNWLIILLAIFLIISIINEVGGNVDKIVVDINSRIDYNLFMLVIIAFIGIGGIRQKEIFAFKDIKKYKDSSLTEEEKNKLAERLKKYLIKEKPYLDSNLKLDNLAKSLKTNRQYLSQVINETYGVNFYNLINTLRVKEVKQQFIKEEHKKTTIMGVAESVGFRSKSVFYTFFKKETGLTPSQFIKKQNL